MHGYTSADNVLPHLLEVQPPVTQSTWVWVGQKGCKSESHGMAGVWWQRSWSETWLYICSCWNFSKCRTYPPPPNHFHTLANCQAFHLPGLNHPLAEHKCLLSLLSAYSRHWNPCNLEYQWYEPWGYILVALMAKHPSLFKKSPDCWIMDNGSLGT